MKLCLYEPEIAQNTGTMVRLAACFGVDVHIIEPAGFVFDDKKFKRSGMDYVEKTKIYKHDSFEEFRNNHNGRIILLDTKAKAIYSDIQYRETDCIMVGKESTGVPDNVYTMCDEQVLIPMLPTTRSLNVAISAAICLSEAMRQMNFSFR